MPKGSFWLEEMRGGVDWRGIFSKRFRGVRRRLSRRQERMVDNGFHRGNQGLQQLLQPRGCASAMSQIRDRHERESGDIPLGTSSPPSRLKVGRVPAS